MKRQPTAAYWFCGLGGKSLGFQRAGFRCVGAFDIDPEACADHEYITGDMAQEIDFAKVMPDELRERHEGCPDVLAMSPPCKGFSGCLPLKHSKSQKYVQLNSLVERAIWLACETWEVPPKFIIMENVPRILKRGRKWLDLVEALLRSYDYSCRETTHDCGELGGLAQHRHRFLMVARHIPQMGEPVHVPPKQRVLAIGDVLSDLPVPLPGSDAGGPLHALPKLSPLNWLRLALIPAGGDWRDLPSVVELHNGSCDVDLPERSGRQNGGFGVENWNSAAHAVIAEGTVRNTRASVADPRTCKCRSTVYGVAGFDEASNTVVGYAKHDNGPYSVADPRVICRRNDGGHGVRGWRQPSHSIIGAAQIHNFSAAVADPRVHDDGRYRGGHGVKGWEEPSATIRGAHEVRLAPASVADPRMTHETRKGNPGVSNWSQPAHTVIGDCRSYKGANVADPRLAVPTHYIDPRVTAAWGPLSAGVPGFELIRQALIGEALDLVTKKARHVIIRAADGTWHRPMTTLELAVLQGLPHVVGGDWLQLAGGSKKRHRERIGNAVPPPAAEAIAYEILEALDASEKNTFRLNASPVWVNGDEQPEASA